MSRTGNFSNALKLAVGSCFGIGKSPYAPGTLASAAVLPLAWVTWTIGGEIALVLLFALTVMACVWSAEYYESVRGKDPQDFVMDEWAGQLLPIAGFAIWGVDPFTPWLLIWSFAGFRIFDIWKPGIVGTIQDKKGVIGLAGDDLIAGLITYILGIMAILSVNYLYSAG